MRTTIFSLALLGTVAIVPAYAQTTPATPSRPAPPAATEGSTRPNAAAPAPMATPAPDARSGAATPTQPNDRNAAARVDDGTRTAEAPAAGANSFTEGQARSRIEAAGFADVSDLQKDDQGVWRGKAQRSGQSVSVALDYQGNVVPVR